MTCRLDSPDRLELTGVGGEGFSPLRMTWTGLLVLPATTTYITQTRSTR